MDFERLSWAAAIQWRTNMMFSYDSTLLAMVQDAPQSIADVLQSLQSIDTDL